MILNDVEKIGPCRSKYWQEMNNEEKIEKLKNELFRSQQQIKKLSDFCNILFEHEHLNNHVVIKIQDPNNESYGVFCFRVEKFKEN